MKIAAAAATRENGAAVAMTITNMAPVFDIPVESKWIIPGNILLTSKLGLTSHKLLVKSKNNLLHH